MACLGDRELGSFRVSITSSCRAGRDRGYLGIFGMVSYALQGMEKSSYLPWLTIRSRKLGIGAL